MTTKVQFNCTNERKNINYLCFTLCYFLLDIIYNFPSLFLQFGDKLTLFFVTKEQILNGMNLGRKYYH
jgi:hypothetical protein